MVREILTKGVRKEDRTGLYEIHDLVICKLIILVQYRDWDHFPLRGDDAVRSEQWIPPSDHEARVLARYCRGTTLVACSFRIITFNFSPLVSGSSAAARAVLSWQARAFTFGMQMVRRSSWPNEGWGTEKRVILVLCMDFRCEMLGSYFE